MSTYKSYTSDSDLDNVLSGVEADLKVKVETPDPDSDSGYTFSISLPRQGTNKYKYEHIAPVARTILDAVGALKSNGKFPNYLVWEGRFGETDEEGGVPDHCKFKLVPNLSNQVYPIHIRSNTKSSTSEDEEIKLGDNVLFSFKVPLAGKNLPKLIQFKAFIKNFSDSHSMNVNSSALENSTIPYNSYRTSTRNISVGFTMYVENKNHFPIQYERIKYLINTSYPEYSSDGLFTQLVPLQFTLGDYVSNLPVVVSSCRLSISTKAKWEIQDYKLPHMIEVDMSFKTLYGESPRFVEVKEKQNSTEVKEKQNSTKDNQNSTEFIPDFY